MSMLLTAFDLVAFAKILTVLGPERRPSGGGEVMLNVLACRVNILGTNCDQCVSMVQCCLMVMVLVLVRGIKQVLVLVRGMKQVLVQSASCHN